MNYFPIQRWYKNSGTTSMHRLWITQLKQRNNFKMLIYIYMKILTSRYQIWLSWQKRVIHGTMFQSLRKKNLITEKELSILVINIKSQQILVKCISFRKFIRDQTMYLVVQLSRTVEHQHKKLLTFQTIICNLLSNREFLILETLTISFSNLRISEKYQKMRFLLQLILLGYT